MHVSHTEAISRRKDQWNPSFLTAHIPVSLTSRNRPIYLPLQFILFSKPRTFVVSPCDSVKLSELAHILTLSHSQICNMSFLAKVRSDFNVELTVGSEFEGFWTDSAAKADQKDKNRSCKAWKSLCQSEPQHYLITETDDLLACVCFIVFWESCTLAKWQIQH